MAKIEPKASSSRKARSSTPGGIIKMLMLRGNPAVAFKDLALPAGAAVAIVSKSGAILEKLRRRNKVRFETIQNVEVGSVARASRTRKPAINQAAFEPDARSLAILEGVRIAQEDLQEAGGAY